MTEAGSRAQASSLSPISAPGQPSVDALLGAARWSEAAALLEQGGRQDVATLLKLRLARNMAAFQVYRPDLYDVLRNTTLSGRYRLAVARDGKLSITFVQAGKGPCFLSDQGQPSKGMERLSAVARDPANELHVMALLGVGDGYFVGWLAANTKADAKGMTLPVFIIEPEVEVIYQAMMIHDWSGPQGPIAQPRFIWAVGAGWPAVLDQAWSDEPQLRHPSMHISQSVQADLIAARLNAVIEQRKAARADIRARLRGYYQGHTRGHLLELLGPTPPRKPRMLFMTSRFSTVVQYSIGDMAQAMKRLGWETRILTDQAPHLGVGSDAILRTLEEFKPDAVFTINHVRVEADMGEAFPLNLPFICWIQDHTRGLMSREMGAAIGQRDFVFVEGPKQYIELFGYPPRQCVAMPKLTAGVELTPEKPVEGEDLVYVSHASGEPRRLYEDLCMPRQGRTPEDQALLARCGQDLLDLYAGGGCCPTTDLMHEMIRRAARRLGLAVPDFSHGDVLCQALYVPLNNALYRQQTLGWIAAAANRLSLRLGIYGAGWETHPTLGRYARGKIAFGPELQALTRRSKINFQIVPYAFYHQRLFEGLMAGGFFLIRRNPHDETQAQNMRAQDLITGEFPDTEKVSFDDQAGLERLVERFVGNPEERGRIAARQRAFVARYFTYEMGAVRVVEAMKERIAAEAAGGAGIPGGPAAIIGGGETGRRKDS